MRVNFRILMIWGMRSRAILIGAAAIWTQDICGEVLELVASRARDAQERTSVALLVRNRTAAPATVLDLEVGGVPIADLLRPEDGAAPTAPGRGVDWYDVQPRTIPAGEAGIVLLGHMSRALREPELAVRVLTDRGAAVLRAPAPAPSRLIVACAAFDADLGAITLMIRNEDHVSAVLEAVEWNGRLLSAEIRGSPVPPGFTAVIRAALPAPPSYGAPCNVRVIADGGRNALAWFRAYPAESLTYVFWSHYMDPRELAAKNIAVGVTHWEGHADGTALHMDRLGGGFITEALSNRMARLAGDFGRRPGAWAWYMQDDAGWGRPRPQTLIRLGDFLRAHGSPQQQFLCNPADSARYAWLHDGMVNYLYHTTHEREDPTVFDGERSLTLMRALNDPAPLLYLVDGVGQKTRWITRAEQEMASYAMLGRGARHLGWFLGPSVWDQGGERRGGIDFLEDKPMRYQEGLTACMQNWEHVGRIAAVFKVLRPFLAASAPLPSVWRSDRIEVLPLLCRDDLIVTVVLNRRLSVLYPRDFLEGRRFGGIRLQPHRDVDIVHGIPSWIRPAQAWVVDHDRGVRQTVFTWKEGEVSVRLDALDTAALVALCPEAGPAAEAGQALAALDVRAPGGTSIEAEEEIFPEAIKPRAPWAAPEAGYRVRVTVRGPATAGEWICVRLPTIKSSEAPIGYFDPDRVVAVAGGRRLEARVDAFRSVWDPATDGVAAWSLNNPDGPARIEAEGAGVCVSALYSSVGPHAYGRAILNRMLDPAFDVLEIRREVPPRVALLLSARLRKDGAIRSATVGLPIERPIYGRCEVVDDGGALPLVRTFWTRVLRDREAESEILDAALSVQVYDGAYRFGAIRQAKSAPDIWVRLPTSVEEGQAMPWEIYWDYAAHPCAEPPMLRDDERTLFVSSAAASVGPLERFGLSAVRYRLNETGLQTLWIESEAQASCAWVDVRDREGVLFAASNLAGDAGARHWRLRAPLAISSSAEQITAFVAGRAGRVVAVPLRTVPPSAALQEIARVGGQVETLACSEDGAWLVAGADKVYAFEATGRLRWTFDLGENRRQPPMYGPGLNVQQVGIRPDGQCAFARTFSWHAPTRTYTNSFVQIIRADGTAGERLAWDWTREARFDTKGGIEAVAFPMPPKLDWPPYTLHRLPLADGGWIVGTTQGRVERLAADGRPIWKLQRPGRVDGLIVTQQGQAAVVAYKRYLHPYDWTCVPTVEVLSVTDGTTVARAEGRRYDDRGHFGSHLALTVSGIGGRAYVGTSEGVLYGMDLPGRSASSGTLSLSGQGEIGE